MSTGEKKFVKEVYNDTLEVESIVSKPNKNIIQVCCKSWVGFEIREYDLT